MPAFVGSRRALLSGGELFNGNPYSFYSLLDIFEDAQAAGAVNGTTPVVGGARVVTDTNSKLSIAGGVANFATGGVAGGNPGLWYPSMARALGKTLLGRIILSGTAIQLSFGWDVTAAGAITDSILFNGTTVLQARSNSVAITVGAYSATTYDLALVMRATGIYYFIKGGTFTNWTLLWISSLVSSSGLPAVGAQAGTTTVGNVDNIRVPATAALYIPPCAAYDTFTRADGALGSTETVGPDGASQVTPALSWTLQDGTIAIVSNKASLTVLGGDLLGIATVTTPSADVMIDGTVTRTLGSVGLMARYADASNYLICYHDGTNAKLDKVVASVTTNLVSAVVAIGAGAFRISVTGLSASLFLNGAAVGSAATVPASSATDHGLYGTDLSATWDLFQVFPTGTNDASYAGLNLL